jgi:hypothetical protein
MENTTIEKIALRYGILTALALVLFFFFMKGIGLIEQYELRTLNIVILFTGIYLANRKYRKTNTTDTYLGGIGVGLFTSAVTLILFSTFVIIYLANNTVFMETLQSHEYFGRYLNPYIAGFVIFLEGTISGLLMSYILMQYYKRSRLN